MRAFDPKRFIDESSQWILEKVSDAVLDGVVIGLSGGVDSAVVAGLCVKLLGPARVKAIYMPPVTGTKLDDMIYLLEEQLGVEVAFVPISNPADTVIQLAEVEEADRITRGNVFSRMRMILLYAFANKLNYLVAGTGNRTEEAIGYFTKYGDGGVDILPIGSLYKSEVWEVAKELGIPKEIIKRPPSAGLWEGQTDEKELGMSYKSLDKAVYEVDSSHVREETKDIKRVIAMMLGTAHKNMPPEVFNFV